jgi:hypothetical protein
MRIPPVSADIEPAWNTWYDNTHLPRRLDKPGFVGARRFRAISGEYKYLSLYELSSLDALTSEPYLALRAREAALPADSFEAITQKMPGFARGVYEHINPGPTEYVIPKTPALLAIGHDVPPDIEDAFNAWYDTEHLPSIMENVPGFVSGRRFRQVETAWSSASGVRTIGPKYLTVYDLADEDVLETDIFKKTIQTPWSAWLRTRYERRFRVLATRIP